MLEIISLAYKSKKEDRPKAETNETVARHAWKLLQYWRIPPGLQDDGGFDEAGFTSWLAETKKLMEQEGFWEVALFTIGRVLFYSPKDADGLWINKTVAGALNHKDAEFMREGYHTEVFNSRGAYFADPAAERKLAEKYRQRADEIENAGYSHFATMLRTVETHHNKEAERIQQRDWED